MGPATVRIGAEDFVTPPEFVGLTLATRSAGQIGGLRLRLAPSCGGTRLDHCYQQMPLRVLPPFHFAGEPAALLYLINPTAGLLDGDGHLLDVTIASGVRALVTGQSATRIHPCPGGFATQQWQIRVEDGGQVVVLPGPAIPFQRCRYYQRVRIDLAAGAKCIWGDIWFPGRYARAQLSELFQFDRIIQDLEVRRAGKLIFRERFSWKGPWDSAAPWCLGGQQASATLFVMGPAEGLSPATGKEMERAILPLASGDTCVRWCGQPAELVKDAVRIALEQAGAWTDGVNDCAWMSAHNFGPNHWFSTLS